MSTSFLKNLCKLLDRKNVIIINNSLLFHVKMISVFHLGWSKKTFGIDGGNKVT